MIDKLKKVSIQDVLGIIIFVIVLIPSVIYGIIIRITKKELWLICETKETARDNGYVFYKYLKKEHPEIKSFYAIDKKCKDYEKVKNLGGIIKWSSFKHYFLYMSSTRNISSHKQGNPNQSLFTVLHLYLHLFNNRVFLQHGVLYQNHEMFHKKRCYFKVFICGAKPEYDFVKEKYGYTHEVKYTGLARFDNLHNTKCDKRIILYMPTWRRYLTNKKDLRNSKYYEKIMSFINSAQLEKLLKQENMELYFCPHDGLKNNMKLFKSNNNRVKIIDITSADIQKVLIKGSILITDFSSVHTDFAYMKKPIIYYQYDNEEFNKKHIGLNYKDTYYSFEKDGFGKVVHDEKALLKELENTIKNNETINMKYDKRIQDFFVLYDNKNCERIYDSILRW